MLKRAIKRIVHQIPFIAMFAIVFALAPTAIAYAANPTVTMSVTAGIISINNTQDAWALGIATPDEIIYFSADGTQDDDYSLLGNDGTLAVDVEIQGTDFEGGDYDWTLGASAGVETYSLYANSDEAGTYSIEVKSSVYNDLKTNLAKDLTWMWSMKFTAPTSFNASDDGTEKTGTTTLVASEYVP